MDIDEFETDTEIKYEKKTPKCPCCKSENIRPVMYDDCGVKHAMMECNDCGEAGEYDWFDSPMDSKGVSEMKYEIGDLVLDEDGNKDIVVIKWNDGNLCFIENDAAHPGPVVTGKVIAIKGEK